MGSFLQNLGLTLKADFLPLFFSCLEAREPISLVFLYSALFTTLKLLDMVSIPAIHLQPSLFPGILVCLGETVRSSMLKSYWLTLDMGSKMST